MKNTLLFVVACLFGFSAKAQTTPLAIDSLYPVRGFCIAAPQRDRLDDFIKFIDQELAPRQVNTLVLRVDFNYAFESHPELRDSGALTKPEVKRLVKACQSQKIRLIPQINLLGHQSWAGQVENLLRVYPQFDETPWVKMPEKYVWPNPDGLYCKSYCPLHPDVHAVVFALMDEICEVFESDAFHAGMDEVFYLGDAKCPRCSGRDPAELYAGEVNAIRNRLAQHQRKLWIWGDRLLDGKTTGMGEWEASFNNTYRAIDLIAKDVTICDWHYERPDQSAVYFAMKGFNVVTCPWNMPEVALAQTQDQRRFRQSAIPPLQDRYQGMMQTIWTSAGGFMDEFYGKTEKASGQVACFKAVFDAMRTQASAKSNN